MENELYTVQNCFKFEEETTSKSVNKPKGFSSCSYSRTMEFRPDKPYRLSLYVQPNFKPRIDPGYSTILANMNEMKRNKDKENMNKCKTTKKIRPANSNICVPLFGEEADCVKAESSKRTLVQKNQNIREKPSSNSSNSILCYMQKCESPKNKTVSDAGEKFLSKARQKKTRRSYEKKAKEYSEEQTAVEPSSDQILKEMDMKKITRSKLKKSNKEDAEFEKWAESMNSAFDDIDKFELSINYG